MQCVSFSQANSARLRNSCESYLREFSHILLFLVTKSSKRNACFTNLGILDKSDLYPVGRYIDTILPFDLHVPSDGFHLQFPLHPCPVEVFDTFRQYEQLKDGATPSQEAVPL